MDSASSCLLNASKVKNTICITTGYYKILFHFPSKHFYTCLI